MSQCPTCEAPVRYVRTGSSRYVPMNLDGLPHTCAESAAQAVMREAATQGRAR